MFVFASFWIVFFLDFFVSFSIRFFVLYTWLLEISKKLVLSLAGRNSYSDHLRLNTILIPNISNLIHFIFQLVLYFIFLHFFLFFSSISILFTIWLFHFNLFSYHDSNHMNIFFFLYFLPIYFKKLLNNCIVTILFTYTFYNQMLKMKKILSCLRIK